MKLVFGKYSGFETKEIYLKDTNQLVGEIEKVYVWRGREKTNYKLKIALPDTTTKIAVGIYPTTTEAERVARDLFKSKENIFELIERQRALLIEATQNLFK